MGKKDRISTLGKRAPDGAYEIIVTGEIGGWGSVDAEYLLRELQAVKPEVVRFIIYSPGGYIVDAITIAGWLQANGVEVYAEIYGYCASAATVFAAVAGPERTEIADGSLFLVHLPYGGDADSVSNATAYLSKLYASAYGWSEEEALAHMQEANGNGIQWTAEKTAELGIGTIMEAARIAARHKIGAMSTEKKDKGTVAVKLTFGKAITAAFGGEVTAEVDLDKEVADQLKEKDDTIAELQLQVKAMEKDKPDDPDGETEGEEENEDPAGTKAKADAEEVKAKADAKALTDAHTKALNDLKAAHAAEITALKKPLAKATVPDNTDPKTDPKVIDPVVKSVRSQFFKDMTPIAKAQYEKALKAAAEKQSTK